MPGDNGFWFNNYKGVAPVRPNSTQKNPKHSIPDFQVWARILPFENAQLLT
jgi:hypothetical protein